MKQHIIITGTGRCGTTFLVQLLTKLGLDTGFTDLEAAVYPNCNAGMELDIFQEEAPFIIKNPQLCSQLDEVMTRGGITIEHVIIPVRDLFASAESRRDVERRTMKEDAPVPGGLWGVERPEEQETKLAQEFHALFVALAKWDISHTLLSFPRIVNDPAYLYEKLRAFLGDRDYPSFLEAFTAVAKPQHVHGYAPDQAEGLEAGRLPTHRNSPSSTHLPSFHYSPGYLSGSSAWVKHLPFGYDLVALLQPSVLVELGTWLGDAFFTFCQAVQQERIAATCYAVDHWQGDPQAGHAGSLQFDTVQRYCSQHYPSFAYLMRSGFAEAAQEFEAGTIDLLHIDGYHSYESTLENFKTWFPLVREGGVILFHDIKVRSALDQRDFGVWRLWAELKAQYETREFRHGFGLGVLFKGQPPARVAEWLKQDNFRALEPYYETRGSEIAQLGANVVLQKENAEARRIIDSAIAWQQSWYRRAFHRWRI